MKRLLAAVLLVGLALCAQADPVFATFIVTNGLKAASIAKAEAQGPDGNLPHPGLAGMFKTALIAKNGADNSPITGWISSGWMSQAEVDYLNSQLPPAFDYSDGTFDTTVDGKPVRIQEDAHAFMARKGYRMQPGSTN